MSARKMSALILRALILRTVIQTCRTLFMSASLFSHDLDLGVQSSGVADCGCIAL
jgi:hypothetical protein